MVRNGNGWKDKLGYDKFCSTLCSRIFLKWSNETEQKNEKKKTFCPFNISDSHWRVLTKQTNNCIASGVKLYFFHETFVCFFQALVLSGFHNNLWSVFHWFCTTFFDEILFFVSAIEDRTNTFCSKNISPNFFRRHWQTLGI